MAELGAVPDTQAAAATELPGDAAKSRSSRVVSGFVQPALNALVDELAQPVLRVDAIAVADIAGQVLEFSQALAQLVLARLEDVAARNAIKFSYFG